MKTYDYMSPELTDGELGAMGNLALAHVGDAVFELLVRSYLCVKGKETQGAIHKASVEMVNAAAQAGYAHRLIEILSPQEEEVYRRGRNAKVNSVPKRADLGQYHSATGLEALFGWLYLKGQRERINELFDYILKDRIAD